MADPKIKVTADTSQAQKQIDDLSKSLADIQKVALGTTKALAAITAGAAAMGYAIAQTLNSAGMLIDAAATLGISVQSLQTFQAAAGQAGVGADEFNAALMRMNANIGDALLKGTGPASAAIERLGLNLNEIAGMKPDKQFELIAQKLNDIPNRAERAAVAMDLFGKQGPKILKVAEDLDEVRKRMEAMGALLTDEEIAALDIAGDKVDELANIFNTGLQKAVADIAPYIIAIADNITKAIEEAGGLDVILAKIGATIKFAMNVALIMAMVKAIGLMVVGIKNAQTAFVLFNTIVKRSPLFLLVGAAAALATYFGVDIVGGLDKMLGISEGVADANQQIADKAKQIKEENQASTQAVQGYNEEQQKVLKALDQTIAKKQLEVGFLENVIKLGEEEANIRKALADEERKLLEAKISLNSKEAQTKLQSLETSLRAEASLKRQIELQKEQASSAFSAILGAQSNFEQALQKQLEFRLLMEGKSAKDIAEIRQQQFKNDEGIRKAAEQAIEDSINKTIDAEIGKYDKLYGMRKTHQSQLNDLLNLELAAELNGRKLSVEQLSALETAKTELLKQQQLERIELERQTQEKLLQIESDRIQRSLMAEQTAMASRLSAEDQAVLQKIGQQERQKQIVQQRIEFEKKSELEKAQFAIEAGSQMFTALGAQNKKAFEIAKAFNIANAIMNTYMGATKALAMYPPPFNFIAAAAVVANGLAQVAQIRSQQYSGREKGGPVAAGMPYIVGEAGPEIFKPSTSGTIVPNGQVGGGGVNVNFTINAVDASGVDELLYNRREVIKGIISDAMLEKGQRF